MLQNTMAGGLGEIHHVLCVNISSKWNGGVFDQKWLQGKSLYDEGLQRAKSVAKGQLISNADLKNFILTKKQRNYFCIYALAL